LKEPFFPRLWLEASLDGFRLYGFRKVWRGKGW
jgi:hypothetical protein